MRLWQQSGKFGRKEQPPIAIYVAYLHLKDLLINIYIKQHPHNSDRLNVISSTIPALAWW
ncbi:hypothetical protein Hdeb2414_s0022g00618081 [Helianthus debilis subsp. tardiflorus]